MSPPASQPRQLPLWPIAVAALVMVSLFVSIALPQSVLASDTELFNERVTEILDGRAPYSDALYEHLPLALPPMLLAKLVPGSDQFAAYALGFAALMTAALIASGFWIGRLGREAGHPRATMRWLAIAWPLFPLVAFRVDPLSVWFAVMAVCGLFARTRLSSGWATLAGVATKGWPIVIAPVAWWAGKRRWAVAVVTLSAVLVGLLLLTPGFRAGREFSGIHLETVMGSVLVWLRSLTGADSGLVTAAGAAYVEAPRLALGVGVVLAAVFLTLTRSLWRQTVSARAAAQLMGIATFALLLASPLLSAQFLLWLTPWLVFFDDQRLHRLITITGVVTLVLLLHWEPSSFLWQSGLLARNGLLLATAAAVVRYVARPAPVPAGAAKVP